MSLILSFCYVNKDPEGGLTSVALADEVNSLDQASGYLPDSIYTTFRTYPGACALHLSDHFNRLEESSRLAGWPIWLQKEQLRANIRQALRQYPADVARVRVQIPLAKDPRVIYLMIGALNVPTPRQRERGVTTITSQVTRAKPAAKLTRFIKSTRQLRQNIGDDIEEVILLDERRNILEGMTSNFYSVMDGVIYTAGEGMLPGITRQIVLEIAASEGIPLNLMPPAFDLFERFDEAFITSSSRGVLPVTEIDNIPVGSGEPGVITRKLMELYDQRVLAEVQPI